jgi:hypothetical protein
MIGDAKLYEVSDDGNTLTLAPVIPKAALAAAREHPENFYYGWNLAVAFFGHTWERVDCGAWC